MKPIRFERPREFRKAIESVFARIGDTGYWAKAKEGQPVELAIYDQIGHFGVTAGDIKTELAAAQGRPVHVLLNSPGGDVFDGIAIYNDLLAHSGRVTVSVQGIAASAASIVAMAGDEVTMAENAFMMIHNAWAIAIGDRNAMSGLAAQLEKIDTALALTYAARSGSDVRAVRRMMDAETWLTGAEAVEQGFADSVGDAAEVSALFDLSVFAEVPAELKREIEAGLRDVGFSHKRAKVAATDGFASLAHRDDALAPLRDGEDSETAIWRLAALMHA